MALAHQNCGMMCSRSASLQRQQRQHLQVAPARRHRCCRSRCAAVQATASSGGNDSPPSISAAAQVVRMRTLSTCELAVSFFPKFAYKAQDGGGAGAVERLDNGKLRMTFDPTALAIPALNYKTASIFGVPIPPPLNIAITPQRFEGELDPSTGVMELSFLARFVFTAGPLYEAPPLIVETVLTTEHSEGLIRKADGARLAAGGRARLVGVARVPRVDNDWFTNLFLSLPTDALAVMDAEFEFE